jgi:hypothetical protein
VHALVEEQALANSAALLVVVAGDDLRRPVKTYLGLLGVKSRISFS